LRLQRSREVPGFRTQRAISSAGPPARARPPGAPAGQRTLCCWKTALRVRGFSRGQLNRGCLGRAGLGHYDEERRLLRTAVKPLTVATDLGGTRSATPMVTEFSHSSGPGRTLPWSGSFRRRLDRVVAGKGGPTRKGRPKQGNEQQATVTQGRMQGSSPRGNRGRRRAD